MNYLIAVLADRIQAEEAYSALEKEGFPMKQVSIVGKGFKDADEFEFLDPQKQARKKMRFMATWLVPFGAIAGLGFNLSTSYLLIPQIGSLGNQVIAAIFGAIGGVTGSFFVGGGSELIFGGRDALPYRKRLNAGNYILVVTGQPNQTNRANRLLKPFQPETVQGYVDPATA
ncbi:MAG TPA: hypothetical protein V6C88_19395 [Chroococcidiopsis sp.]